jgi:hypothetical protein
MTTLSIFRAGRHTAMSGATLDFTEADLEAMVKAYDPAKHEAPLVVGHPVANAPAYGWVKSLAFAEGEVQAEPHQVDEAFQEMVGAGRFKKISASLYTPTAPANPVPGVYYLRHVGFLGAQPPAVKGLRDASFGDSEAGVVAFGDFGDRLEAGLWRRLREWIIGKFGLEEADKALSGRDIDQLKTLADAPDESGSATSPAYAEEDKVKEKEAELKRREEELNAKQADLDQKDAAFAERLKTIESRDRETRMADMLAFCEGLVKAGQLPPTHKDGLVAFMAALDPESALEFGEGDARKSEPALGWLKGFLSALPAQLTFGESGKPTSPETADFAAAPGCTVDAAGLEIHAKALGYQRANPNTTYLQAVKAVSQESR